MVGILWYFDLCDKRKWQLWFKYCRNSCFSVVREASRKTKSLEAFFVSTNLWLIQCYYWSWVLVVFSSFVVFSLQSPLHLAAITKQPRMLDCLLRASANVRSRDRHGNTAVHIACMHGDAVCLKALLNFNVSKTVLNWQNYQGNNTNIQ